MGAEQLHYPPHALAAALAVQEHVAQLVELSPAVVEVTLAEPLKLEPPIVRVVVRVAALPVVDWLSVGKVQFVSVPLDGVPSAPLNVTGPPADPTAIARAAPIAK